MAQATPMAKVLFIHIPQISEYTSVLVVEICLEQANKLLKSMVYGSNWKNTISALCFIAEPQNLRVNLQLNSHLFIFWVQTPGPSTTKFCGQNCACSFFPNFHRVGATEMCKKP